MIKFFDQHFHQNNVNKSLFIFINQLTCNNFVKGQSRYGMELLLLPWFNDATTCIRLFKLNKKNQIQSIYWCRVASQIWNLNSKSFLFSTYIFYFAEGFSGSEIHFFQEFPGNSRNASHPVIQVINLKMSKNIIVFINIILDN